MRRLHLYRSEDLVGVPWRAPETSPGREVERNATRHLAGSGLLPVARYRPGPAASSITAVLCLVRLRCAQQQRVTRAGGVRHLVGTDAVTWPPSGRAEEAVHATANVARDDALPPDVGGAAGLLKAELLSVHGSSTCTSSSVVFDHYTIALEKKGTARLKGFLHAVIDRRGGRHAGPHTLRFPR